jgi:hypothetical protein
MAPLLGLVHSPAGDALCASSGQNPVGANAMSGFKPVNDTLIGGVFDISKKRAMALFARMEHLGAKDVAVSRRAARAA